MLFIQCKGGLTSRLDVVGSIALSKHYPDNVTMVWDKGPGIMADFSDLFDNDIPFIKKEDLDFNKIKIIDEQVGLTINPLQYKDTYIAVDHPVIMDDVNVCNFGPMAKYEILDNFLLSLKPKQDIIDLVNRYSGHYANGPVAGMNIRRGSGINYHQESSIFSPTGLFVQKAKEVIDNKWNCLLTTDSFHDVDIMCMEVPQIFTIKEYLDYPLDSGYTIQGMKRTIADWLMLAKCKFIYTGKNTGFAYRISRMYNISIEELVTKNKNIEDYHNRVMSERQRGEFL